MSTLHTGAPDIFQLTMQGFEAAFQVRHIATFRLTTCGPDESIRDVWERQRQLDQLPVERDGIIIGVLERGDDQQAGLVSERMRRLDDSILVSAAESLTRLIPLMDERPYYRLVLDGTRINGIVTRSDLLKLPVRLLAFALVTHLELTMATIIRTRYPDDKHWLAQLSEGRQQNIQRKREALLQRRSDPPLLELTDFADKRDLVRDILGLPKRFKEELEEVERLRNQVAHAATYVEDDDDVATFVQRIQLAEHWIAKLS